MAHDIGVRLALTALVAPLCSAIATLPISAHAQTAPEPAPVATRSAQGDVAAGAIQKSIEATVVGVRGAGDTGQIVVDVSVPYDQAAELAARAATGKVALVLDSRER